MSNEAYPTDEAILTHLCETIDQIRRKGGGPPTPPPSKAQIERLISVAFAASLESEEGRRVTFNLFYTPENRTMNYRFRERSALSANALVRLSAALESPRSNIAITGEGDKLEVAGVWHSGSGEVGLFAVRVVGPGVLVVKYDARLILTYRRGQFVPYDGNFNWINDAGALLRLPGAGYPVAEGREEHAVVCRFRIVDEMLRIAHGGTLLVVPPGSDWQGHVATEGFAPISPETRVRDVEEDAYVMWTRRHRGYAALADDDDHVVRLGQPARMEHAGRLLAGHQIRQDLAAELNALARLSATDGMVLILPNLVLLGFGVFFKVGEPACRIESHDPYERAPREIAQLAALGGARHQSAAVAAASLPGSLAVVASSDGSLTAMRRASGDDALIVHKHLELRLPPWPAYQ